MVGEEKMIVLQRKGYITAAKLAEYLEIEKIVLLDIVRSRNIAHDRETKLIDLRDFIDKIFPKEK